MTRAPRGEFSPVFERQVHQSTPEFWRRFGRRPPFDGRRVLDLACGHGAMGLEIAGHGASVLGVDVDGPLIEWARTYVGPRVPGRLEFEAGDIRTMGFLGEFDLVLCKDSIEHIQDVPGTLKALRDSLTPGGEIWIGSAPFFYSPYGDHRRTGMKVPWAHTLPWPLVRRAASRHLHWPVDTCSDIGLNRLTPAGFRRAVTAAGLNIQWVRYNAGDKRLLPVLRALRRVPGLERYATVGIYAVLVKD